MLIGYYFKIQDTKKSDRVEVFKVHAISMEEAFEWFVKNYPSALIITVSRNPL